jgi:SPP1 family predicted phage head-tail adaptor
MSKKKFANKTFLDPGRFRYNISFYEHSTTINNYGDQTITDTLVMSTRASKQNIQNRPGSIYSQLEEEAGATLMNGDTYFTIRLRQDWQPKKDMHAVVDGIKYVVRALIPLDYPQNYWRILCTTTQIGE